MKFRLVALLVCAFVVGRAETAAPAQHAITHEDVWLMKRIGSPVVSPDGKWAVFSVNEPAYEAKDALSDLWIKSLADESPARRLTSSKGGESSPDWSPDSQRLLFGAKREGDESTQLYVLEMAGGEAQRITSVTLGARQGKWSPDGKKILFVSDVYPNASEEDAIKKEQKARKDRKYNARSYEQFPPRFWMSWLDDRKPSLFVQDATAGAKPTNLLAGSKLAASPGFGGGFGDEGGSLEAEWAPDGSAVVFVAAINREAMARANAIAPIFSVSAKGGEPKQLTSDEASYGRLEFAPDGKSLFCIYDAQTPGKVYDLSRLASFPWPFKNERKVLTADYDRSIGGYAFVKDRVFFTSEHAGLEKLYSIAMSGGEVKAETCPETGATSGISAGGAALVGLWESAVSPPEIYSFGGEPKRLTSFNVEKAATIDWLPLEHFEFTAADGRTIHNMIVKPANFDPAKKYPLFTMIHGGAASMWKDAFVLRWNYHLFAAPGYVVLLTDYKGSTGYGEEFARAIQFDPLKGPADEINQAVDEAVKRYSFVDGEKLAAGGASYGGHLANWLQATTTRYKCIVSHAGEADLIMQWGTSDNVFGRETNSGAPIWSDAPIWREQSPIMQAGNHEKGTGFKSPILITVGELDFRVPLNNAYMWFTLNQRLNVPSKLVVFPEAGHWILRGEDSRFWYGEVQGWLAKYLK